MHKITHYSIVDFADKLGTTELTNFVHWEIYVTLFKLMLLMKSTPWTVTRA